MKPWHDGGMAPTLWLTGDPEQFATVCATPPAVHRYPRSMAGRVQAVAAAVLERYDGDATRLWTDADPDGTEVLRRLKALPGFGDQKARIRIALPGKQRGIQPAGWRQAAGDYGEEGARRSIADVTDERSLTEVRETKKALKASARAARPTSTPSPR